MNRPPRADASSSLLGLWLTPALIALLLCVPINAQDSGRGVPAPSQIIVGVGMAKTIEPPAGGVVQVDIADPNITGVYQYSEQSLVVTGKKLGVTTIVLWPKSTSIPLMVEVRVDTTPTLSALATQITTFINSNFEYGIKEDVNVIPSPLNDKVIVSGKVKNQKIATAILSAIESFQLPSSSIVDNLRVK